MAWHNSGAHTRRENNITHPPLEGRTVQATPMRSIGYRTADARDGGVVLSTMRTARSCSPPPARSARDLPLQEGVKSETHRENDEACPRGRATSVTKVATKAAFRPLRASNMFERTLRH